MFRFGIFIILFLATFAQLTWGGVWLVPVMVAMVGGGPSTTLGIFANASRWAFVTGLLVDLVGGTPLGMHSLWLLGCVASFWLIQRFARQQVVAVAVMNLLIWGETRIFGHSWQWGMLVVGTLLWALGLWVWRWVERGEEGGGIRLRD